MCVEISSETSLSNYPSNCYVGLSLHSAAAAICDLPHPTDLDLVPHRRTVGASDESGLGQVQRPTSCDANRCVQFHVTLYYAGRNIYMTDIRVVTAARIALGLLMPLFGILVKWLVIGRYRAGRYPLWGSMYLKWWIVEQTINIMGKVFLSCQ